MSLIKCPECGKEISDQASTCINCGCPMENILNKIKEEQNKPEYVKACSRCGLISWNKEKDSYKENYCIECRAVNQKHEMINLPYSCKEFENEIYIKKPNGDFWEELKKYNSSIFNQRKKLFEKYVKDWDSLDKNCIQYKLNIENLYQNGEGPAHTALSAQVKQEMDKKGLTDIGLSFNLSPQKTNQPKCPICGSTDIKKISAASKVLGASMFGLFSKTARSQFECKNCGYKF